MPKPGNQLFRFAALFSREYAPPLVFYRFYWVGGNNVSLLFPALLFHIRNSEKEKKRKCITLDLRAPQAKRGKTIIINTRSSIPRKQVLINKLINSVKWNGPPANVMDYHSLLTQAIKHNHPAKTILLLQRPFLNPYSLKMALESWTVIKWQWNIKYLDLWPTKSHFNCLQVT